MFAYVALRKESVDRNNIKLAISTAYTVALRKESVDRNSKIDTGRSVKMVALRKESVDRNQRNQLQTSRNRQSLSARRAWIEIKKTPPHRTQRSGRSPQGERG